MKNMFSKSKTEIPNSIDDCVRPDKISSNLWEWCAKLEKYGFILFWVILVCGIASAVVSSISVEEITIGTRYTYTKTETTFLYAKFLTQIISTVLYAFIEYCAYHVLALLIGSLASIVESSKISANISLYNAAKDTLTDINTPNLHTNKSSSDNQADNTKNNDKKKILCNNCGALVVPERDTCWKCGHKY